MNSRPDTMDDQLDRALALGKGVIKCDLVLRQSLVLAAPARFSDFFRELDKLLQHLDRTNVTVASAPPSPREAAGDSIAGWGGLLDF